ncbi:MAG: FhaA domain-containing protein [Armatimonadota bacterium]
MDLLSRLERALEDVVEGVFTRAFRTQLQPIEIAKRLTREVETHRTLSVSATYVPNEYTVHLAPETHQTFQPISVRMLSELEQYLREYISERNYQVIGPVAIHLACDEEVRVGELTISVANNATATPSGAPAPSVLRSYVSPSTARPSHTATADTEKTALINVQPSMLEIVAGEAAGRTIPLTDNLTLGRGPLNQVSFADPGISRHHAEIVLEDEGWKLRDAGSTNGTHVNGHRVTEQLLRVGDTIEMGSVVIKVR